MSNTPVFYIAQSIVNDMDNVKLKSLTSFDTYNIALVFTGIIDHIKANYIRSELIKSLPEYNVTMVNNTVYILIEQE